MKAFQELGCLFWERPWRNERCCGMEDLAMLVFYLPIIIFEAMLEATANKRKAGEPTVSLRPVIASENELRDTVSRRHFQNP
jgi:hypothetical protein